LSLVQLWYILSKTLAEEAAWKFAEGNGIDLVSINPGFVIGPFLQPTINLTVEMIQNLITGTFFSTYVSPSCMIRLVYDGILALNNSCAAS
jgi:nucleoside-diphosphate-sugar epimerase